MFLFNVLVDSVVGEFGSSELGQVEVDKFIDQHTTVAGHDAGLWASKDCFPEDFKCTVTCYCQYWAFNTLKTEIFSLVNVAHIKF